MKRMIALLLACLMVFALMACASTKDETTDGEGVVAEQPETEQPVVEEPVVEEPAEEEPVEEEPVVEETPIEEPAGEGADISALQTILDTLLLELDAEFIPYYSSYEVPQADAPYVVGYEQMDTNFDAALGYSGECRSWAE